MTKGLAVGVLFVLVGGSGCGGPTSSDAPVTQTIAIEGRWTMSESVATEHAASRFESYCVSAIPADAVTAPEVCVATKALVDGLTCYEIGTSMASTGGHRIVQIGVVRHGTVFESPSHWRALVVLTHSSSVPISSQSRFGVSEAFEATVAPCVRSSSLDRWGVPAGALCAAARELIDLRISEPATACD